MTEQPRQGAKESPQAAVWICVLLVVVGFGLQFVNLYPGIKHHPYLPAVSLLLTGAPLLYLLEVLETPVSRGWKAARKVTKAVGEALIVVAIVVVLFEFPHFKEFYEDALRNILTTRAYITKLSADEQRDIVQSVVASRLRQPLDGTIAEAYTRDLLQQIEEGQYVVLEDRYFEKSWTRPERDSSRSQNRMTRQVHIFGQRAAHRLDDLVGGQFEYWVVVDRTQCLTVGRAGADGQDRLEVSQTPEQRRLCQTRITPIGRANHIKVQIPLESGLHTISRVIRRREPGMGSPRTDIGLDYVTRSMSVKFHYPPEMGLEVVGHGDLEIAMASLGTVRTPQPDQNEFDQSFQDSWFGRGASMTFLLSRQN